MNSLYEAFPTSVDVLGVEYPIITDFREWIKFMDMAEDDEIPIEIKLQCMLQYFTEEIPRDLQAAVQALREFLLADELFDSIKQISLPQEGVDSSQEHDAEALNHVRAYDYTIDQGYVIQAFLEVYHIDLLEIDYMHWWKFRLLFEHLPEETAMKKLIYYRTVNLNSISDANERKRIKKIRKQVAIKKKKRKVTDYQIGDAFW